MAKLFKRKRSAVPVQAEVDIAGLMDSIQQQLNSLERKVDTLINQSSGRPSERPFRDRSFGRSRGSQRQDRNLRERSMTKVICAECGIECEVPFKPSEDRPVYCKECFAKRKGEGSMGSGEGRGFQHKKKASFRRRNRG